MGLNKYLLFYTCSNCGKEQYYRSAEPRDYYGDYVSCEECFEETLEFKKCFIETDLEQNSSEVDELKNSIKELEFNLRGDGDISQELVTRDIVRVLRAIFKCFRKIQTN